MEEVGNYERVYCRTSLVNKVRLNRVFLSIFTSIFGASLIIILFGVLI